jgi:hypothetical protein
MAESSATSAADATRHHNRSTHAYVRLLGTTIGPASATHGVFAFGRGNRTTGEATAGGAAEPHP